jgi:hypothetical protein
MASWTPVRGNQAGDFDFTLLLTLSTVTCCFVCFLLLMQLTSYGKLDAGEEAMKQEILARGPIVCGVACPEEFVYKYHSAKRGGELLRA